MGMKALIVAEAANENPPKRRRGEADAFSGGVASLNDDCLLLILRFLLSEELNSFAMCSRRCREARRDPSLDQTRTGTVIWLKSSSILQLYDATVDGEWNNVFSGTQTQLMVVGLEEVETSSSDVERLARDAQLPGVTSLDLSYSRVADFFRTISFEPCKGLALILPNLREIDLSYSKATSGGSIVQQFCGSCPHLFRLSWNHSNISISLSGVELWDAGTLTEVYLDGSRFYSFFDEYSRMESPISRHEIYYILMYCKRLERVSIKNATWHLYGGHEVRPVSQGTLIKFVRNSPTLRWLRNDLTEENVTMLQQERPDMTFITD